MQLGYVNNSLAVQSFGVRKTVKGNKNKKIAKIVPRRSNIQPTLVVQPTSQVLSSQFVAQNQMAMQQQSAQQQNMQYPQNMGLQQGYQWQQVVPQMTVQQQSIQQQIMPQQQTGQYPQNMDNIQFTNDELPFSLAEMSLENNPEWLDSPTYRSLFNELDKKELTHKEKIQNQILQNREQFLRESILYNNLIAQNNNKHKEVSTSLTQFVQLLTSKDYKNLNGLKKQIKEVLEHQKVLKKDVEIPSVNLYNEIIKKRQENSDYELSLGSLNDNLRLLTLSKKAKNLAKIIVEKTQNDELKKSINNMGSCFCDDVIQGVKQAFKELNKVYILNNEIIDKDIQYRESYIKLITDFITYEEFEETLPSLNSFSLQNLCEDDSIMF